MFASPRFTQKCLINFNEKIIISVRIFSCKCFKFSHQKLFSGAKIYLPPPLFPCTIFAPGVHKKC